MRNRKARARALAIGLTCIAAAALFVAGPASAASRGYVLHNKSSHTLEVKGASRLPNTICNAGICVRTEHPMEFEGRPGDGSTVAPNATDRWELKYHFGNTYAAALKYKIVGTDATVEYTIETTTFSNNSACKVVPASAGKCSAAGLNLSFEG